jgi:hypothetical protein
MGAMSANQLRWPVEWLPQIANAAPLSVCFNPVTHAIAANHPAVTWCD